MELVRDMGRWEDFLLSQGYELHGQLDSGGFSDVFAVSSVSTGRAMAVKRIVARRSIMADPRLKTEISCLTKLRVPGSCVIWLEEVMVRDSVACLVLELAPLGDLERYTSRHWPLSPELVKCCVRQVSTALTHCHRLHIAHRDLHPANVLLLSPRRVRLGDFGLAVTCSPSRPRPPLCRDYEGRQTYVGPEVLAQRPYDALRADLWSLGALCAFLATGHHPEPALPCPECGQVPTHHLLAGLSDCEKGQFIPSTTGQYPSFAKPTSKCSDRTPFVHQTETLSPSASSQYGIHSQLSSVTHSVAPHFSKRTADHRMSCQFGDRSQPSPPTHSAGLHIPERTKDHKAPVCRSVKEFLPTPPRSKRYRASSCDSQGSCRSESDSEESSSPQHSCSEIGSSDTPLSSSDDVGRYVSNGGPQEHNPTSWALSAMETETFAERTPVMKFGSESPSLSSSGSDGRCPSCGGCTQEHNPTSSTPSGMETGTFVEHTPVMTLGSDGPSLSSSEYAPRCLCGGGLQQGDLTKLTSSALEAVDERTRVKKALVKMVFKLCVVNPLGRLRAEDALEMWKQSVKKVPKT